MFPQGRSEIHPIAFQARARESAPVALGVAVGVASLQEAALARALLLVSSEIMRHRDLILGGPTPNEVFPIGL
jgi:hypothetical protein